MAKRKPITERFFSRIKRTSFSSCWIWIGCRTGGYGHMRNGHGLILAHRFSWEFHRGAIPEGIHVLHRCDVPSCVNPDHLFLGSHADNMRDAADKGVFKRRPRRLGEKSSNHKLDEADIVEIRKLRKRGLYYYTIAAKFGVTKGLIHLICSRKIWTHIP